MNECKEMDKKLRKNDICKGHTDLSSLMGNTIARENKCFDYRIVFLALCCQA
jgi:hypothetical protein